MAPKERANSLSAIPDCTVLFVRVCCTAGQAKGKISAPIGANTPFPLTLKDDFDSYPVDAEARFFAE